MSECDNIIKLVLVGDSHVGKTCITSVFCDNKYSDLEITTIGVDFRTRILSYGNHKVKLQIWDTAGQERFRSITTPYYRNAHGIIIVFDLTNYSSFENLNKWLKEIEFFMTEGNYKVILVSNKCDDKDNYCIPEKEIDKFIKDNNLEYIQVSAKNNIRIEKLFEKITVNILDSNIKTKNKNTIKPITKSDQNRPCCLLI